MSNVILSASGGGGGLRLVSNTASNPYVSDGDSTPSGFDAVLPYRTVNRVQLLLRNATTITFDASDLTGVSREWGMAIRNVKTSGNITVRRRIADGTLNTITTLTPGQATSIFISQYSVNGRFLASSDLILAKGEQGDEGDPGTDGEDGDQGDQGPQGFYRVYAYQQVADGSPIPSPPTSSSYDADSLTLTVNAPWQALPQTHRDGFTIYYAFTLYDPRNNRLGTWSSAYPLEAIIAGQKGDKGDPGPAGQDGAPLTLVQVSRLRKTY